MHYSYSRAILAPSRVLVRDVLFVVDLWLSSLLHFHRHSSLFITADNEKRPIDVALNPIEFLLFKLSTQFQIWRRRFKVKLSKSFFFCILLLSSKARKRPELASTVVGFFISQQSRGSYCPVGAGWIYQTKNSSRSVVRIVTIRIRILRWC